MALCIRAERVRVIGVKFALKGGNLSILKTVLCALLVFLGNALPAMPRPVEVKWDSVGKASAYGKERQGKHTSSGEVFDYHKLTAAHRTLPFGSIVLVINLHNNKSVKVRINDRGPGIPDRIIDVSTAAMQRLGFDGVTDVRIEVLYYGEVKPDYSYLALSCKAVRKSWDACRSYFSWDTGKDPIVTEEMRENLNVAGRPVRVSSVRRKDLRPRGNRPAGGARLISVGQGSRLRTGG